MSAHVSQSTETIIGFLVKHAFSPQLLGKSKDEDDPEESPSVSKKDFEEHRPTKVRVSYLLMWPFSCSSYLMKSDISPGWVCGYG